ncbi:MAG: Uma2 family endonuclease [Cyclobacteriaceae bacterium]|nr:Uma2 family endonuclease [Cyclobacteriaceae bacterium]
MQETLTHPPRTLMEVFKMFPEGTLAGVINNQLYMSPSPVGKHQCLVTELTIQVGNFVKSKKSGEIFVSPFDVFLNEESNAVRPDLILILRQGLGVSKRQNCL